MKELIRRAGWLHCAAALIAVTVLVVTASAALAARSDAGRIDAAPRRVDGAISALEPMKGGPKARVDYTVDGHRYSTDSLGMKPIRSQEVGVTVPLEVAAGHPEIARVVGEHYPGGDDDMPTRILTMVGAAAALVISVSLAVQSVRRRRREGGQTAPTIV